MPPALVVKQMKVVPGSPEQAFALVPQLPLDRIFRKWHGPIPPIRRVILHDGEWRAVGQTRTMLLVGGSTLAQVVYVDPPRRFEYRLTDMRGVLAPLMDRVEGTVTFAPGPTGTAVTWQWTIHPKSAASMLVLPIFARLWPGWANRALVHLADQLTH